MEYLPSKSNVEFVKSMSAKWPDFKRVVAINVELYKEIIPHGVMADYAQIIWDTFEQSGCTKLISEVLSFIDSAYKYSIDSNNVELESLILASFIYNISNAEFNGTSIIKCMPPRLAEISSKCL